VCDGVNIFLPCKKPIKQLFLGTRLGEELQAMSFAKAVPKGLKWVECEHSVSGKTFPIRYIPEQHSVQDALEKCKNTIYFKLTLSNMGNELKVAIWASGTPEQFLLHVHTAIHVCKQMGLDTNFADAKKAVMTAKLDAEIAKMECVQVHNSEQRKNKGNKSECTILDSEAWQWPMRIMRRL
jgi:hypothetical protein